MGSITDKLGLTQTMTSVDQNGVIRTTTGPNVPMIKLYLLLSAGVGAFLWLRRRRK